MQKRSLYILVGLGALIVLWTVFRPEKLFVNQKVNESLPAASTSPRLRRLQQAPWLQQLCSRALFTAARMKQRAPLRSTGLMVESGCCV